MPNPYTGSPAAPPVVTPPVATRSLHREANTLNDELLLTIEALRLQEERRLQETPHITEDGVKGCVASELEGPSSAPIRQAEGERHWQVYDEQRVGRTAPQEDQENEMQQLQRHSPGDELSRAILSAGQEQEEAIEIVRSRLFE
mmetsp:Transcript_14585/g.32917  ORF Transcript_14585/g.32917 Transcript_14585/m.32917 type:complete len:144 (-) Transcript_14585:101-532(-)